MCRWSFQTNYLFLEVVWQQSSKYKNGFTHRLLFEGAMKYEMNPVKTQHVSTYSSCNKFWLIWSRKRLNKGSSTTLLYENYVEVKTWLSHNIKAAIWQEIFCFIWQTQLEFCIPEICTKSPQCWRKLELVWS